MLSLALVLVGCATAEDTTQPDVDKDPYWSSGSETNEGKSTHLFIVNRAIDILGKHTSLPRAARARARLTDPACRPKWQEGLKDADDRPGYNNWFTFKSHFYDPSTGTNYLGGTNPVAYNEALSHLATARTKLAQNDISKGCYELGLALHYATDLTQPMHAANFAATDYPLNLHSHLEDRAVDVQNLSIAGDWSATPTGTAAAVLLDIAWTSNGLWTSMWGALAIAYDSRCDDIDDYTFDHTSCWSGDAGVDAAIGAALRHGEAATAAWLYAADLP